MESIDFSYIGQRIKEARYEKKLTQDWLAEKTGVNVSHISNIETNKVKVSLTLLIHICNALDVTVDFILGKEYHNACTAIEKELLNTVKKMDNSKKEQLLRIAKVL